MFFYWRYRCIFREIFDEKFHKNLKKGIVIFEKVLEYPCVMCLVWLRLDETDFPLLPRVLEWTSRREIRQISGIFVGTLGVPGYIVTLFVTRFWTLLPLSLTTSLHLTTPPPLPYFSSIVSFGGILVTVNHYVSNMVSYLVLISSNITLITLSTLLRSNDRPTKPLS